MTRLLTFFILVLFLAACRPAEASDAYPSALTVEMLFPLQQDEARFRISWTAPVVGERQRAIERYEVRVLLEDEIEVYNRTDVLHPQTADTVGLPWPELDETEGPYRAQVRTIDVAGASSDWVSSTEWTVTGMALPPSPPGDVQVDTMVVGVMILPQRFEMFVGEQFQMCAYAAMSDGSWLLHADLEVCENRLIDYMSQQALRFSREYINHEPLGEPVRLRIWPHVVAVQPGYNPPVCSARFYPRQDRLDYAPGCYEEAVQWARSHRDTPLHDFRFFASR